MAKHNQNTAREIPANGEIEAKKPSAVAKTPDAPATDLNKEVEEFRNIASEGKGTELPKVMSDEELAKHNASVDLVKSGGLGHNNPPSGHDVTLDDGVHVLIPNEAYIPEAKSFLALSKEIGEVQSLATTFRNGLLALRRKLTILAVDWTVLRTAQDIKSEDRFYVVNGLKLPAPLLVLYRNNAQGIKDWRSSLSSFLKTVMIYMPQEAMISVTVKDGKPSSIDTDASKPSDAVIAGLINEVCNTAELIYFGEFSFQLAWFTPSGNKNLSAKEIEKNPNIAKEKMVAFFWDQLAPFYSVNGGDVASPHSLIRATSNSIAKAWKVYSAPEKYKFDKYGDVVPATSRAATVQPAATTPATAPVVGLVDAANAAAQAAGGEIEASGQLVPAAGETPTATAPEVLAEIATYKKILFAEPMAVQRVFSVTDKASHDLKLATAVLLAAGELYKRLDWSSERVQKDVDVMNAAADLNRLAAEVADKDTEAKRTMTRNRRA